MPSPTYKTDLLNFLETVPGDDLRERVAELLVESRIQGETWPTLLLDPEIQGNPLLLVTAKKAAREHNENEGHLIRWLLQGIK